MKKIKSLDELRESGLKKFTHKVLKLYVMSDEEIVSNEKTIGMTPEEMIELVDKITFKFLKKAVEYGVNENELEWYFRLRVVQDGKKISEIFEELDDLKRKEELAKGKRGLKFDVFKTNLH